MIKNLTPIKLSCILCLLFSFFGAQAQIVKDTSDRDDQPILKIGVSYTNNNVFYGRSDTVKTPTIIPFIKYTFASGIYLAGDLNYVTNRKSNKVDGGSIGLGYEFTITDNLEGGASFTKLFYNSNSTQVNSANRASFNANLSYNIADIVTPWLSFDYDLNKKSAGNDVFINVGLSHDFDIEKIFTDNDNLSISPTFEFNSGTQNFYNDYVETRATRNKKSAAVQSILLANEKAELAQYKLLDYEFSLPVEYEAGHIMVNFIPTYALAKNKLPANISSALSSSGNIFYFRLGFTVKL